MIYDLISSLFLLKVHIIFLHIISPIDLIRFFYALAH